MDDCSDPNIPHGLGGYRRYGCRGPVCRAANAEYQRKRRAAQKGKPMAKRGATVSRLHSVPTSPPPVEQSEPGPVERAVIDECAGLTIGDVSVVEERPAYVQMARSMARILDNPRREKDHTPASNQLRTVMEILHAGAKTKSKGRLVAIQKMTNRRPAQGE